MKLYLLLIFICVQSVICAQMDTVYFNSFHNWNASSDGWVVIDNDTNSIVAGQTQYSHLNSIPGGYVSVETIDNMAGLYRFNGSINQLMITPELTLGNEPFIQLYSKALAYFSGTASIECWVIPNSSDTTALGITDSIRVLNNNGFNLISLGNYANSSIRLAFKLKGSTQAGTNLPLRSIVAFDDMLIFNKTRLVYIPDNAFRNYLQTNFPSAFIGDSLNYLSPTVTGPIVIQANTLNIQDLEGLQYFPYIRTFKAHHNQLLSFPLSRLPYLDTLNVSYNLINVLPDMPRATRLYFDHNLVHTFPDYYNNTIDYLYANNNLIYGCLPQSNRFVRGSVLNNMYVYTPGTYYYLQRLLYGPTTCITNEGHIKGKIYFDQNNDGNYNLGESLLPFQPVLFAQSIDFTSNEMGNYHIITESGSVNLDVTNLPSGFSCVNPLDTTLTANQEINHDFRVVANQNIVDLSVEISTLFNTSNSYGFIVTGQNWSTQTINTVVKIKIPSGSTLTSNTFGTIINDTIFWTLALTPFENKVNTIELNISTLTVNMSLNVAASALVVGDNNINNNFDIEYFIRQIPPPPPPQPTPPPYDPNFKVVSEPIVDTGFFDYEFYTIRFENLGLGNATYVNVQDQFPALLDPTTFQFLGSTHPAAVDFGLDNIIQFTFNDITLTPKSIDSLHSFGYIWFKIKPTQPLQLYDTIKNRAYIIFNTENPVITDYSIVYVDPYRIASNNITDSSHYCKGDVLYFTDLSNVEPITFEWHKSINNQLFSVFYSDSLLLDSVGVFQIQEIVTWENGVVDTVNKTIFVTQPDIQFNSTPTICNTENQFLLEFAEPQGGQFSGFAVSNNILDATLLPSGQLQLNYTYTDINGCENNKNTYLTIGEPYESFDSQTLCFGESLSWQNQQLNTAGNYTQTYTRTNGCDSVINLDLSFLAEEISDTTTYNLCNGNSLNWHNQSINNAGVYQTVLSSINGCDSTLSLIVQMQNNYSFIQQETICPGSSITWFGNVIDQPGNYTYAYQTEFGCDSVFNLNFNFHQTSSSVDSHSNCGSFTWIDGNTYTTSNNSATYIVPNSSGCDSIITLNLTIINSSSGIDSHTACGSFTWIDGNNYSSSNNTATFTIPNAAGCDSIIALNLTINQLPNTTIIDNSDATITASTVNSYQWYDCNNNVILVGETSQTFSPIANGTYACVGTNSSGCSDTSNCVVINNVSINNLELTNLTVHPNPTTRNVTLTFTSNSTARVQVMDAQGKFIQESSIVSGESISLENYEPGIYFLNLEIDGNKTVKRLVKQ